MSNSDAPGWPSPTCSGGDLETHTKRLRDGTLELAIGAHAANNLFGAVVLGFEGAALNTPALFYTDRFVPSYSLIQFLVAAALFYLAVFVLFKRPPKEARSTPAPRAVGSRRSSESFPKQQVEGGTRRDAAEG